MTVIVLALVATDLAPAWAVPTTLTLAVRQTPSVSEPIVTLYGQVKPAKSGLKISIQVEVKSKWHVTSLSTKTTSSGTWRIESVATALNASVKYRALIIVSGKTIVSKLRSVTIKQIPEVASSDPASLIASTGPGGRIHGMDISRWQHPDGKSIDFVKMYGAGIRFVMIKASDTRDLADAQALSNAIIDHNAAQAAGIYTGFYHYATLPNSTDPMVIIQDAKAQAQKVAWRLASLGGYTQRDLPYALDLENKCVLVSSTGACHAYVTRSAATLWTTTWLAEVAKKTNRLPIIYSGPYFLESSTVRTTELLKYPLWIAHYALDPFDPLAQPGQKNGGCYVHSWTTSNCSSLWTMWQYTSCGIAKKYGVPGTRVDLNVFRGTPNSFLKLVQGTWEPEVSELMPSQEPSQTFVQSIVATSINRPVLFTVNVVRPTGTPVVTGTVRFFADKDAGLKVTPVQSAVRSSSGSWVLSVKGLPAGTWPGKIKFTDISGTHATSSTPVVITLLQGAIPTPKPTTPSTPKPTTPSTPKPAIDGCKNQIKN